MSKNVTAQKKKKGVTAKRPKSENTTGTVGKKRDRKIKENLLQVEGKAYCNTQWTIDLKP